MDFKFSKDEAEFRNKVDEFIVKENPANFMARNYNWPCAYGGVLDSEAQMAEIDEFMRKMFKKGYVTISWPKEYGGGGGTYIQQAIITERLGYYRAPVIDISANIAGPTILRHGSEQMKKEWIPKIVNGDRFWLAYSEPNAGSDLASIKTTAIEDGDHLIVNGQKIWSSRAHISEYGWMIARSDLTKPSHKGSTLFIVDSKSPGITIRPIINICGFHSFNEVFFDSVRVPKKNIVGEKNMGFYYLMTALDYERIGIMSIGGLRKVLEELIEYARTHTRHGKQISSDPIIRDKMASLAIEIELAYMYYFKTAWMMDRNLFPNIEASAFKLMATELSAKLADVGMAVIGQRTQIMDEPGQISLPGRVAIGNLDYISAVIGGGASEILRNIIAQRGMRMPRR
jgi:3-oxocholest-4-en-26-oyl-CoA dehydrogenase alpha subunit